MLSDSVHDLTVVGLPLLLTGQIYRYLSRACSISLIFHDIETSAYQAKRNDAVVDHRRQHESPKPVAMVLKRYSLLIKHLSGHKFGSAETG